MLRGIREKRRDKKRRGCKRVQRQRDVGGGSGRRMAKGPHPHCLTVALLSVSLYFWSLSFLHPLLPLSLSLFPSSSSPSISLFPSSFSPSLYLSLSLILSLLSLSYASSLYAPSITHSLLHLCLLLPLHSMHEEGWRDHNPTVSEVVVAGMGVFPVCQPHAPPLQLSSRPEPEPGPLLSIPEVQQGVCKNMKSLQTVSSQGLCSCMKKKKKKTAIVSTLTLFQCITSTLVQLTFQPLEEEKKIQDNLLSFSSLLTGFILNTGL